MDRCATCHIAADRHGFEEAKNAVFRTHPSLNLMVGSESPHPYGSFGCTPCHGGRDRASSFWSAGHSPETSDVTGLRGLATLPDWLLEVARPDRLRTGLSRWVEEFARGDLVLEECRPKHFRLQGATWAFL